MLEGVEGEVGVTFIPGVGLRLELCTGVWSCMATDEDSHASGFAHGNYMFCTWRVSYDFE